MKRSWMGLGLLGVLLGISLLATAFLTRTHEEVSLELEQSAQCALLGDWENAGLFLRRAKNRWEKWEHIRACLMDHGPAEEIDASFAMLDIYRQAGEAAAYRASCAALLSRLDALSQAHTLTWWNVL